MSADVYVFITKVSKVSGRKYGVIFPEDVEEELKRYHGRKVVVHIYVPKYLSLRTMVGRPMQP